MDSEHALISPEAFNHKLLFRAWFNSNIIIWFTIFAYPLFTILDFIYAGNIWQVFFFLRVFVAIILYLGHEFAVKTRRPPYGILHVGLVLMSLIQALECNLVGIDVLPVFFILFTAIFISYNLIVFWKASNSFIHLLAALVFLSGFQLLLSNHSANELVNNGGFFFFIIAALSCAIPQIRMVSQSKEITSQLELEISNGQLQMQRDRELAGFIHQFFSGALENPQLFATDILVSRPESQGGAYDIVNTRYPWLFLSGWNHRNPVFATANFRIYRIDE